MTSVYWQFYPALEGSYSRIIPQIDIFENIIKYCIGIQLHGLFAEAFFGSESNKIICVPLSLIYISSGNNTNALHCWPVKELNALLIIIKFSFLHLLFMYESAESVCIGMSWHVRRLDAAAEIINHQQLCTYNSVLCWRNN